MYAHVCIDITSNIQFNCCLFVCIIRQRINTFMLVANSLEIFFLFLSLRHDNHRELICVENRALFSLFALDLWNPMKISAPTTSTTITNKKNRWQINNKNFNTQRERDGSKMSIIAANCYFCFVVCTEYFWKKILSRIRHQHGAVFLFT